MATGYVTHSDCSLHDPGWGQPEHQGRLPAVARAVYRDMLTLFPALVEMEGATPPERDLERAHDPAYLRRLRTRARESALAGRSLALEGGVSVSGGSWDAARAAVGCAITAVDAVLDGAVENAFCAVRPPGHLAGRDGAAGHGLLNPVAVAALHLRAVRGLDRVLVVDLGARAGLGTAAILAADPGCRVLLVSGEAGPDLGAPGTLSAPFPAAADAAAVGAALDDGLDRAGDGFRPDFLLLSLGFDLLSADPSSTGRLEPADYHPLTRRLVEAARRWCGGRLVSVLEEGYDAAAMGAGVVQHLRGLADLPAA